MDIPGSPVVKTQALLLWGARVLGLWSGTKTNTHCSSHKKKKERKKREILIIWTSIAP